MKTMQAKDELSALEFTRILLMRFKTVWRMRQKLGWRMRAVQSTDKKPKRAFCDTFTDVIFTGEFSVKTELYPRRSFRKAGENTVIKVNQEVDGLFCFSSRGNLSIPV